MPTPDGDSEEKYLYTGPLDEIFQPKGQKLRLYERVNSSELFASSEVLELISHDTDSVSRFLPFFVTKKRSRDSLNADVEEARSLAHLMNQSNNNLSPCAAEICSIENGFLQDSSDSSSSSLRNTPALISVDQAWVQEILGQEMAQHGDLLEQDILFGAMNVDLPSLTDFEAQQWAAIDEANESKFDWLKETDSNLEELEDRVDESTNPVALPLSESLGLNLRRTIFWPSSGEVPLVEEPEPVPQTPDVVVTEPVPTIRPDLAENTECINEQPKSVLDDTLSESEVLEESDSTTLRTEVRSEDAVKTPVEITIEREPNKEVTVSSSGEKSRLKEPKTCCMEQPCLRDISPESQSSSGGHSLKSPGHQEMERSVSSPSRQSSSSPSRHSSEVSNPSSDVSSRERSLESREISREREESVPEEEPDLVAEEDILAPVDESSSVETESERLTPPVEEPELVGLAGQDMDSAIPDGTISSTSRLLEIMAEAQRSRLGSLSDRGVNSSNVSESDVTMANVKDARTSVTVSDEDSSDGEEANVCRICHGVVCVCREMQLSLRPEIPPLRQYDVIGALSYNDSLRLRSQDSMTSEAPYLSLIDFFDRQPESGDSPMNYVIDDVIIEQQNQESEIEPTPPSTPGQMCYVIDEKARVSFESHESSSASESGNEYLLKDDIAEDIDTVLAELNIPQEALAYDESDDVFSHPSFDDPLDTSAWEIPAQYEDREEQAQCPQAEYQPGMVMNTSGEKLAVDESPHDLLWLFDLCNLHNLYSELDKQDSPYLEAGTYLGEVESLLHEDTGLAEALQALACDAQYDSILGHLNKLLQVQLEEMDEFPDFLWNFRDSMPVNRRSCGDLKLLDSPKESVLVPSDSSAFRDKIPERCYRDLPHSHSDSSLFMKIAPIIKVHTRSEDDAAESTELFSPETHFRPILTETEKARRHYDILTKPDIYNNVYPSDMSQEYQEFRDAETDFVPRFRVSETQNKALQTDLRVRRRAYTEACLHSCRELLASYRKQEQRSTASLSRVLPLSELCSRVVYRRSAASLPRQSASRSSTPRSSDSANTMIERDDLDLDEVFNAALTLTSEQDDGVNTMKWPNWSTGDIWSSGPTGDVIEKTSYDWSVYLAGSQLPGYDVSSNYDVTTTVPDHVMGSAVTASQDNVTSEGGGEADVSVDVQTAEYAVDYDVSVEYDVSSVDYDASSSGDYDVSSDYDVSGGGEAGTCPPVDEVCPPCPPGDEAYPLCPPGDEASPPCPPGDEVYPPCPPGDEDYPPCPPGDEVYPPCPPGDEVYPPCPPGDEVPFSSELEEQWLLQGLEPTDQLLAELKPRKRPRSGSWSTRPCTYFLEGTCRRSDCRFSHDLSTITCRFWSKGECFKGVTCPFLHGFPSDGDGSARSPMENVTRTSSEPQPQPSFPPCLKDQHDFPPISSSAPAAGTSTTTSASSVKSSSGAHRKLTHSQKRRSKSRSASRDDG